MKTRNSLAVIILLLILCFAITGCGKKKNAAGVAPASESQNISVSSPAPLGPSGGGAPSKKNKKPRYTDAELRNGLESFLPKTLKSLGKETDQVQEIRINATTPDSKAYKAGCDFIAEVQFEDCVIYFWHKVNDRPNDWDYAGLG